MLPILLYDYCFNSETTLSEGIWMSFCDTEEAHAVMLAYAADRGGRAALKVTPASLDLEGLVGNRHPPGSSGKSMLKAAAQPAQLNRSLLFLHSYLRTGIQQGEVQKEISISLTIAMSNQMNANYHAAE